ncbi:MAG TPA: hypothetical protein VFV23_05355 [Verrucomicrobiae bacterium]|nr:hypothetical protein [Verrucomicrobiae bacterium]
MNENESISPETDLHEQIAGLQRQVFSLLLALVVLSGTLVVYLYYQSHIMEKDVNNLHAQAKPVMDWVAQNQTGVEKFKADLVTYSKTHPEFLPILKKYGYTPTNTAAPKK